MKNNNIDVVLVTYNPDMEMLRRCIESIHSQVRKIWIVDNDSTGNCIQLDLVDGYSNIELIQLSENKGIAYAQNEGITKSLKSESEYILLSDQDTAYPEEFVKQMRSTFDEQFDRVAAVAPLFHNVVGKEGDGFIVLSKWGYVEIFPTEGLHKINQAIASGLLIKSSTLNAIGFMDEDLFIDWVDFEWCWRAIAKDYLIIGNANVLIEHNLGDGVIKVGNREITTRSPIRHYYMARNGFHLAWHCPYLDFRHKLILVYSSVRLVAGFSIFVKPRVTNLRMTVLGFYHSLIGRLGRLD